MLSLLLQPLDPRSHWVLDLQQLVRTSTPTASLGEVSRRRGSSALQLTFFIRAVNKRVVRGGILPSQANARTSSTTSSSAAKAASVSFTVILRIAPERVSSTNRSFSIKELTIPSDRLLASSVEASCG